VKHKEIIFNEYRIDGKKYRKLTNRYFQKAVEKTLKILKAQIENI
jgi:hypothetical protein